MCSPAEASGLTIKDIECFNDASLAKCNWKYRLSVEGLWSKVLHARYGNWRKMDAILIHRRQYAWWQDLCRIFDKEELGNWFEHRCQWSLGDGRSINLWEDKWAKGRVLKEKFPRLFSVSQCLDSKVGNLAQWEQMTREGCLMWKLGWRRERFVWEEKEEETMLAMISKLRWCVDGQDKLVWVSDVQVKFGYSVLNMEDQMQTLEVFLHQWRQYVHGGCGKITNQI